VGPRVISADEVDFAGHQHRNEREIAAESIKLGNDHFALCFLQAARAFSNSGRSLRLPLSISVNSSSNVQLPPSR
jgi:hypothetical protein